jgi:tetratricopeptide (TPR) repeat protein
VMSMIRIYMRQHAAAEEDLKRALALNPGEADSIEQMGYLLAMRGRPLEALNWMDRAIRLNPIFPPWYQFDRALALYGLGEYEAAAEAMQLPPQRHLWHDARLAACYAQMGDRAMSKRLIEKVFAAFPNYPLVWIAREQMPYERTEDNEHLAEGFTLALEYARD